MRAVPRKPKMEHILQVADYLKKNKQEILDTRPTYEVLEDMVHKGTGINMNGQGIIRIANEVGVKWQSRQSRKVDVLSLRQVQHDIKLLARAIIELEGQTENDLQQDTLDSVTEIATRPNGNGE